MLILPYLEEENLDRSARGEALAKQGQLEQAMEDFTQTIALNGELASASALRAELLRKLGRTAEADADRELARRYGDRRRQHSMSRDRQGAEV